jgi:hypothetical protein
MIPKLLEAITGKDDLERVAWRENLAELNECLKTRRVWVPRRPKRYLDASHHTQAQFLKMMEDEAKDFSDDRFEPWVLELDGKKRLPIFSSQKKMEIFASKVSQHLNKVFWLGGVQMLFADVIRGLEIDFADLNAMTGKNWEIGVKVHDLV